MPTTQTTPKKKSAKKELHESLSEKIIHMLSDITHSVAEIPFKKMVKKAAKVITETIHTKKDKKAKKAKKKSIAKPMQVKITNVVPVKKAVKKMAKKSAKKTVKKAAKKSTK